MSLAVKTIDRAQILDKFRVSTGHVNKRGPFRFVDWSKKSSKRSNHENIFSKTFA